MVKNYLDYAGLTYFKEKLDAEYASIKAFVFKGAPVPFVMELPNYRMPGIKNVARLIYSKMFI